MFNDTSSHVTWDQCQQQCRNNGGNMVSIHSNEENQFIFGKRLYRAYRTSYLEMSTSATTFFETWIGFRDQHPQQHEFAWIDGTPFDYTNWGNLYPLNDTNRACGFMFLHTQANYDGKLGNMLCDIGSLDICICKQTPIPLD